MVVKLTPQAETLKTEGNNLYSKGSYEDALAKYTEAIALVPQSAVLFANRAACYISLKRHEDALSDALKATELDPKYPRAWVRLGSCYEVRYIPF
ncbi:hypothetical protein M422DRAFT_186264 [Sphaerobolus stellatus SS14]|uniref:Uncharacterized protein n=1 Tax=Sphaerobolus stellatus (strain SS14) TaxID=990650 RepID=A0A0C9TGP5_SPHS4|nr:hypothetical protein M422DRAFT_189492 [Sphaerobolus stellatus SS14]KIJ31306.1 hypothetical protein M422DRAFT_186264 [Sphaerobolus stellatus SS14]